MEMHSPKIKELLEGQKSIIRFGPPNKFDHAPKGTLCIVHDSTDCRIIYEQTSDDDESPDWKIKE